MIGRLRRGGFEFNVVGRSRTWFVLSAILILVSLGSLGIRGLNLGLEFRGGTAFEFEAETELAVADVRDVLAGLGVSDAVVQRVGDAGFLVQAPHLGSELQRETSHALAQAAGIEPVEVSVIDVGPKWGEQVTNSAVRALLIFFVVAVIYISLRLEPKMAGVAMLALVHDLTITAGIYSLTGFSVTPASAIALLTILGYSLYDTVVIFDRVKERAASLSAGGSVTYAGSVNQALNRVLVRSLNTSITSLLPVGSLLFVGSFLLGAETLRELALALFIGMAAGTYSSIFVAAPVLAHWKEREAKWATLRARIAARSGEPDGRRRAPAQPRQEPAPASGDGSGEEVPASANVPAQRPQGHTPAGRPPPRPPRKRGKKKKKKR